MEKIRFDLRHRGKDEKGCLRKIKTERKGEQYEKEMDGSVTCLHIDDGNDRNGGISGRKNFRLWYYRIQ